MADLEGVAHTSESDNRSKLIDRTSTPLTSFLSVPQGKISGRTRTQKNEEHLRRACESLARYSGCRSRYNDNHDQYWKAAMACERRSAAADVSRVRQDVTKKETLFSRLSVNYYEDKLDTAKRLVDEVWPE
jgi:hypothetical protein